MLDLTILLNRW